jgi:hypothetical protein
MAGNRSSHMPVSKGNEAVQYAKTAQDISVLIAAL